MSFRPISDTHSIEEVAFALVCERPFTQNEVDRLYNDHKSWSEDLPRREKAQAVMIGTGPLPESPIAPISFTRFKPDGSPQWRLAVRDDQLIVNCIDYTNWREIWPIASKYIQKALPKISKDLRVRQLALQVVDVFFWEGDKDDYNVELLIRRDSSFMPESIWERGAYWHLHQGWFSTNGLPVDGRQLERMHIDSADNMERKIFVKFDHTLRLDLKTWVASRLYADKKKDKLSPIFDLMHKKNKEMLKSFLTDEMKSVIGIEK